MEKETKIIYIKGTNDIYKKSVLFECVCEIEGDKILLGKPFLKGSFPIEKFKDNSKEKPFNYIIAMDTYEKAINKDNPFKEFYDYFEIFLNGLEEEIKEDCESINKDISSDYKGIYFHLKNQKAISSLRISLDRRSITKFELSFENPFTREKEKLNYTNKDFEEFKEKLQEFKEIALRVISESKKENPYFKEILEFTNKFKECENTEFYYISLRCNEFLDRLSIYFRIYNYQIPQKFNDSIERSNSYSLNIDNDKIYLQNGSERIEEEDLSSFEKLKEFILNKIIEIKQSKISKIEAKEILNKLRKEQSAKDELTEDKFKDFCERFNDGEKITIYGVESLFGTSYIEGRIVDLNRENKTFSVLAKGKRNRGLKFRIGSYYQRAERGYLK